MPGFAGDPICCCCFLGMHTHTHTHNLLIAVVSPAEDGVYSLTGSWPSRRASTFLPNAQFYHTTDRFLVPPRTLQNDEEENMVVTPVKGTVVFE